MAHTRDGAERQGVRGGAWGMREWVQETGREIGKSSTSVIKLVDKDRASLILINEWLNDNDNFVNVRTDK